MPTHETRLGLRGARWMRAARQTRVLSWFSLAWMTGEGVLGMVAGVAANSISLVGWALGSVIEGLAAIIVIWRFTGDRTFSEVAELRAGRGVALSFFLLAPTSSSSVCGTCSAATTSPLPLLAWSLPRPVWSSCRCWVGPSNA